jgi:hypothetical protein
MKLGIKDLTLDDNATFVLNLEAGNKSYNTVDYARDSSDIVMGLITSELTLGGANSFSSPLEDSSILSKVSKTIGTVRNVSSAMGNQASQAATMLKSQTIDFYTGSSKPEFALDVVFITLDSNDNKNDATAYVKDVLKSVYPTSNGQLLNAPLGYNPFAKSGGLSSIITNGTPSGTVTLRVGRWFLARNLVVQSANFTMSREVTASGKPLYASGSISLAPYRALTYDEVKKWFIAG